MHYSSYTASSQVEECVVDVWKELEFGQRLLFLQKVNAYSTSFYGYILISQILDGLDRGCNFSGCKDLDYYFLVWI